MRDKPKYNHSCEFGRPTEGKTASTSGSDQWSVGDEMM